MLDEFASAAGTLSDDLTLLNGDGYWLKGSDPADEWGFMFKQPLTLGHRYPEVWARLRTADRGQLHTSSGLWTWRTLYPLKSGEGRRCRVAGARESILRPAGRCPGRSDS